MQKIRVMFVMLQLDAGGSERVVLDLVRGLDHGRFETFITAFNGGALEKPLRGFCKEIFFIQKKQRFDVSAMLQIAGIVRLNRIDVVNAHHYMPCFYSFLAAKILNRKRLVYTEHSVPEVKGIATGIHKEVFGRMLFRIDTVVGVSREIRETFRDLFPRHSAKFSMVLNGVDIAAFNRPSAREQMRRQWGFSEEHFVIGNVANLKKVKNHACLLRAVARLQGDIPQMRLVIAGRGFPGDPDNSEDEIRGLIGVYGLQGKVILAGYQEDIPGLLSGFDLFCLPSLSEGLPVSILEAMAAAVPVIGSKVKGVVELVEHHQTGYLFVSDDDGDLCEKITEVMDHPVAARKIAAQAFEFVRANHNIDSWIANYADILRGGEG